MNALMERWVQTCRRELLDRTLIWDQRHLHHALHELEQIYNSTGRIRASPMPALCTRCCPPSPSRVTASAASSTSTHTPPELHGWGQRQRQRDSAVRSAHSLCRCESPRRAGLGRRVILVGGAVRPRSHPVLDRRPCDVVWLGANATLRAYALPRTCNGSSELTIYHCPTYHEGPHMIDVEVLILPSKRREEGRIDPSSPLEDIKADIAAAYDLGDPDSYDIAIQPRHSGVRLDGYKPQQGDTLLLIERGTTRKSAFQPKSKS
jgi:hypothetical protein